MQVVQTQERAIERVGGKFDAKLGGDAEVRGVLFRSQSEAGGQGSVIENNQVSVVEPR